MFVVDGVNLTSPYYKFTEWCVVVDVIVVISGHNGSGSNPYVDEARNYSYGVLVA